MRRAAVTSGLAVLWAAVLASPLAAEPRIEMELATEAGFPITGAHRWYKLLTDLGVDGLRIRGRTPRDEPQLTSQGTTYKLVGLLTADDKLVLPGGSFSSTDTGRLKKYLESLRSGGVEAVTEKPGAFGLTKKQLTQTAADFSRPIDFTTQGVAPQEVVEKIRRLLGVELVVDPAAARALASAEPCRDELKDITAGTGLAALLRPMGLVLQPLKASAGEVQYLVTAAAEGVEAWPVGWPTDERLVDLLPVMFEFLNVEIEGLTLSESLDAIQPRIKAPFLIDHNALARHEIDITKQEVSLPAGRSFYKKIIDRLLFQSRLKSEIRVDEAGRPLVWITTIKR